MLVGLVQGYLVAKPARSYTWSSEQRGRRSNSWGWLGSRGSNFAAVLEGGETEKQLSPDSRRGETSADYKTGETTLALTG